MKKREIKNKDSFYMVLNLVFAILTMALSLSLMIRIVSGGDISVALFLGLSISSQILFQCLLFVVHKDKSDRKRIIFIGALYLIAAVIAFIANTHYLLFYIANALVVVTMALNQFLVIGKGKTKREIFTSVMVGVILLGLCVAIFIKMNETNSTNISLVTVFLFLFTSIKKLLFPSFKIEKIRLLINILVKTHTIDAILCLVAFIIAFSFMFPLVEESINNFWDAMWYCFAVITTIGFGDFAATSLIGRILTVVLGIYGIVIVAILTSVVVNFYNEVTAKEKASDIIE